LAKAGVNLWLAMLVNFVIGGTQKGGTSALDSFLRQHPQICMPETRKELHYFDKDENFDRQPNYKKYHANFKPGSQHRVIGEATPIYMYWNAAPARIWSYNSKMKWIIVLRNPVERAFSAWNMETKRDAERLSFKEAVEREPERCREALPLQHRIFSYIDRGFYSVQVRRIFNIFGRENCLILLNEDLRNNHQNTLRGVFDFLGVDQSIIPKAASVFEHDYDATIDPALNTKLTEMFFFDIKELERLLQRDLSAWYAK
jgi:Sulfotransferase domain